MSTAVVRGLEKIAERLGRDPSTAKRWIDRGILEARKAGPFLNSPLVATADHIDRLRHQFDPVDRSDED